jgi:hypothetical protein
MASLTVFTTQNFPRPLVTSPSGSDSALAPGAGAFSTPIWSNQAFVPFNDGRLLDVHGNEEACASFVLVMFDALSSPNPHPADFDLSVYAREAAKERISVLRNARPYSPAGKLLHGDELAFEQRIKFFPLGNVVGRVPDQYQCRKFMGAEHAWLLIA